MDTGLLCRDSEIGTNKFHNEEVVISLISPLVYHFMVSMHDLKPKYMQVPLNNCMDQTKSVTHIQGNYYGKCKIIEEPLFAFITTIAIIHEDISIPLLQSLNMNLLQLLETQRNSKLNFIRCLILKT